jgi:hypothetical protein
MGFNFVIIGGGQILMNGYPDDHPRKSLDLSGVWQIAFDPQNEGVKHGWGGERWPQERALPVHVPGSWNIDYPDAEGVGFYRTTFTVPDSWQGQAVLLHFEGAIYRSEIWIGGRFVGSHEGGYTPFWINITDHIRYDEDNLLIVRVTGLSKTRAVDGMVLEQTPLSKQSWYYTFAGIWGHVSLEAVPLVSCLSVSIDPDLRREQAQVELCLSNWRDECRQVHAHLKVFDPHGVCVIESNSEIPVPPGQARFNYTLNLPRPAPWSCDHPNLYRLEVELVDEDSQLDRYSTHFGMRDFTVQDGRFFLNGEQMFLRGVLLQPNYPVTLIAHPNREMMVREITLAKEAGFNLIRVHIQPAPPGFLDLADQMGMLIYAESCLAWIRESPRMLDHGRREIAAMISRDRNHPSVVFWGIYNENPPASIANSQVLGRLARSIDPTRVIVDNSGGSLAIDQDFGWIDRATVTPAGEAQAERNLDVHLYLGSPISAAVYNWLRGLGTGIPSSILTEEGVGSLAVMEEFDRECRSYRGQILVSELGYGGMSNLIDTVEAFGGREDLLDARELKILRDGLLEGFQKRHLGRIFGSPDGLFHEAQELQALGNTQQLEAVLTNPRVSGFVITQLNDVSWEFHAGLLDLWRNPKLAYYAAQRVNKPHLLVLRAMQTAVHPGETLELELSLVSRDYLSGVTGLVTIGAVAPAGDEVYCKEFQVQLRPGIHLLENIRLEGKMPGAYRISASLSVDGQGLAEAEEKILVLEQVEWQSCPSKPILIGEAPASSVLDGIVRAVSNRDSIADLEPDLYLAANPASLTAQQWESLLAAARAGGVILCGALRIEDQVAIQAFNQSGVKLKLHPGIGSWMGCYHWIPESNLFSGLPSGGLAKKPYSEILPKYVLSEMGGEIHAGSLRNTQSREQPPAMLWYSDIESLPYGKGAIVFCQYRAFENIGRDPLAERLAYNLLTYAAGLPAKETK